MIFVSERELINAIRAGYDEIYSVDAFKRNVKVVFENKAKRVFGVKMKNGDVITVHCAKNDTWDSEKALLACYVKYMNHNNGKFNGLFDLRSNVAGKEETKDDN